MAIKRTKVIELEGIDIPNSDQILHVVNDYACQSVTIKFNGKVVAKRVTRTTGTPDIDDRNEINPDTGDMF